MVRGDVDRCPSDLPNVPIALPTWDVAIALMAGMNVPSVIRVRVAVDAGSIMASRRLLLSPLLHFSRGTCGVSGLKAGS